MSQKVLPKAVAPKSRFDKMTPEQMKQLAQMFDRLAQKANVPTKRVLH